jgi:hypothetical protein
MTGIKSKMTLLTIFSAPKPFTDPHIALIQRNAIRSWVELGPEVEVILVGEEDGLAQAAAELGVKYLPQVRRNASGTPLVSSMFELARQNSSSPLLACVNADILLLPDFLAASRLSAGVRQEFLLVGQRWDLAVHQPLDFSPGWPLRLNAELEKSGRLHTRGGSDYFIFPRRCFMDMPEFAIGRAGWDNWMIYSSRRHRWPCVDATESIQIIHQDHNYAHLPGGEAHYRQPESFENIRLAGGRRTIFTLMDADQRLVAGRFVSARPGWPKFWRDVETFPLVWLGSYSLAQVTYAIFHPWRAYRDFRSWLRSQKGGKP